MKKIFDCMLEDNDIMWIYKVNVKVFLFLKL